MSLEVGYGIVGFFCALTCVIVALGAMRSNGLVSREPVGIAAVAAALMGMCWLNGYPSQSETLSFVAVAFSLLAAWAAWKDSAATAAAMRQVRKPT